MGKREQAREEAAFMRGDVGVDGAATEEKQDAAEVEKGKAREALLRGKAYLGREFLTWLLWRSESGDPLTAFEKAGLTVLFTRPGGAARGERRCDGAVRSRRAWRPTRSRCGTRWTGGCSSTRRGCCSPTASGPMR